MVSKNILKQIILKPNCTPYSPINTYLSPSSTSFLVTLVLISRPLQYVGMLFNPKISPETVIVLLRNPTKTLYTYKAKTTLCVCVESERDI